MNEPAVTLDVLPAAHGDCLLVQCPVKRGIWRMLVDTDRTTPIRADGSLRPSTAAAPSVVLGRLPSMAAIWRAGGLEVLAMT